MLKRTHEAYAPVPWLVGTGLLDVASLLIDHHLLVQPVVALLGVPLTRPFAAGLNSPDMDQRWAPGRPRDRYNWRYHRGFTHRLWFALWIITPLWAGLMVWGLLSPWPLLVLAAPLAMAPPAGWWSHLIGDVWFGRLPVYLLIYKWGRWRWWRFIVGRGEETGGPKEVGLAKKLRDTTQVLVVLQIALFVWAVYWRAL